MQYGSLVRETITLPHAVTEKGADAVAWVMLEDDAMSLVYTRPVLDHESYVEGDGSLYSETCRQWVGVYRYYPQTEPERSEAMAELMANYE